MIAIRLVQWLPSKKGRITGAPYPDRATTTWNGKEYVRIDTHGAIFALARQLLSDGCPDQPWETYTETGTPSLSGPSLHRLAKLHIREDDGGIHLMPYVPFPAQSSFPGRRAVEKALG